MCVEPKTWGWHWWKNFSHKLRPVILRSNEKHVCLTANSYMLIIVTADNWSSCMFPPLTALKASLPCTLCLYSGIISFVALIWVQRPFRCTINFFSWCIRLSQTVSALQNYVDILQDDTNKHQRKNLRQLKIDFKHRPPGVMAVLSQQLVWYSLP